MGSKSQYQLALSFWKASFEYLMLVENIARETIVQGNTWFITKRWQDGPVTEKEYHEGTKWSDHTIIIPMLFNLYHGIELLVKGFLLARSQTEVKPTHTVQHLCRQFYNAYPGERELNSFLRKYTEEANLPAILGDFLRDNAMTFDDLYQALRYPSDRNFQTLKTYIELKYKGTKGIPFFKELHQDIEAKPQVGPSFGNNFNNRTEEAIGSALDLWTAFREKTYLESPQPFLGYFFMLEDCGASNRPVGVQEPHFKVFPDFVGALYMRRYELFCRKLVLERHYTASAFITSSSFTGLKGTYKTPADDLSVERFAKMLVAHVTTFV